MDDEGSGEAPLRCVHEDLEADVPVDNLRLISSERSVVHALCRYIYAGTLLFRMRTYWRQSLASMHW
jgi:hypothetical protein